jgi:hypothetical protein
MMRIMPSEEVIKSISGLILSECFVRKLKNREAGSLRDVKDPTVIDPLITSLSDGFLVFVVMLLVL